MQRGGLPRAAFELQGGVEEGFSSRGERVHVGDEEFRGRGKNPVVVEIHAHEGGDVHLLGGGIALGGGGGALAGGGEPIVVALAEGAVNFGHEHGEISGAIVEIVEGDGIENVAEVAEVGEEEDLAVGKGEAVSGGVRGEASAEGLIGGAEMIFFAVRGEVPFVVGGERGNFH